MTNVDMVRSSAAEDTSHGSRASIRRGHRSDAAGVDHGLIERFDHDQFIRAFLRPHRRRLGTPVEYTNVAGRIEDWATGPDADKGGAGPLRTHNVCTFESEAGGTGSPSPTKTRRAASSGRTTPWWGA